MFSYVCVDMCVWTHMYMCVENNLRCPLLETVVGLEFP